MDLRDASHMVLMESAAHPDLLSVTRAVHDDFSAGRPVASVALTGMLAEASRKGVLARLKEKHGDHAVNDMITVLAQEIDGRRTMASSRGR